MISRLRTAVELCGAVLQARFRWRHPIYLIHAVTGRCNARCGFCAWNPEFYQGDEDLTTAEVKQLYRDARNAGFLAVSIWGGEPLLRKDIGELVTYARRVGLMTHMVTNGALLGKRMDVVEHLDRICISVDHPSERHDRMRKIPGLYGRILSATAQIRSRYPAKKIVFVYTIQKENVAPGTIEAMAEVMRGLGVVGVFNALRLEPATTQTDAIDITRYNPSDEELAVAFRKVSELKRRGYPILNSYTHLAKMTALPLRYRCHWPKFLLPIEANGDVVDCMHWGQRPIANVKEEELASILKHPRLRALAGPEGERCHKCVSMHRVDISEACEGHLEPLWSWVKQAM